MGEGFDGAWYCSPQRYALQCRGPENAEFCQYLGISSEYTLQIRFAFVFACPRHHAPCIQTRCSDNRGMLIPRFSVRSYFIATVVLAIFFVMLGCAVNGQGWARGVSVAIIGAAGTFAVYAVLFAIAWSFVEGRALLVKPRPQSPFAGDDPPKQIIPPVDM